MITRRVVGLSGYFTTIQPSCFVSPKNTISITIFIENKKLCFCFTSNITIYLTKTARFWNLKTTLMCTIGTGAGNQETWAPKNTCRWLKKTAELNKINCLTRNSWIFVQNYEGFVKKYNTTTQLKISRCLHTIEVISSWQKTSFCCLLHQFVFSQA